MQRKWQKYLIEARKYKPQIYYHVTSRANIPSIRRRGVEGSTQAGDRDVAYGEGGERRVYLFSREETAFMAAFSRPDSGIFGGAEPPFAFVEVNLAMMSPEPKVYDDMELPEFDAYYIVGDIPSHAIRGIESEENVADRLNAEEESYNMFEAEDRKRIRLYEVLLVIKIADTVSIESTITDIRSIVGVTIVSTVESQEAGLGYGTTIKVKFHPQKEAMTAQTYVKQILIPTINSREIPGSHVLRYVPGSLQEI